jgi:CRISPR-associated exonuclease Cas4
VLTASLIAQVERIAVRLNELLKASSLPAAVNDARCPRCSLRHDCLPSLVAGARGVDPFAPLRLGDWDA